MTLKRLQIRGNLPTDGHLLVHLYGTHSLKVYPHLFVPLKTSYVGFLCRGKQSSLHRLCEKIRGTSTLKVTYLSCTESRTFPYALNVSSSYGVDCLSLYLWVSHWNTFTGSRSSQICLRIQWTEGSDTSRSGGPGTDLSTENFFILISLEWFCITGPEYP